MISKLLPILLALVGLGIGVGAGIFLRPAHEPATEHSGAAPTEGAETPKEHAGEKAAEGEEGEVDPETAPEYVKMSNQFVVPVMENGNVAAMVILAISLEVT